MADPARARKLADRIKVIVAETLEMRIKDPRLGFVTITDSRVTGDLHEATVYYTVYGTRRGEDRHGRGARERPRACCAARSAGRPASASPRPSPSSPTPSRRTPCAIEDLLHQAAVADAEVQTAGRGGDLRRRGRPLPQAAGRRRPRGRRRASSTRTTTVVRGRRRDLVVVAAARRLGRHGRRGDERRPGAAARARRPRRRCARLRARRGPRARARGVDVAVSFGDDPFVVPRVLRTLPGQHLLVAPAALTPRPVVVSFDVSSIERLGVLRAPAEAARTFVAVDHHSSYTGFGGVHLVDVAAPATAVLALEFVDRLGVSSTPRSPRRSTPASSRTPARSSTPAPRRPPTRSPRDCWPPAYGTTSWRGTSTTTSRSACSACSAPRSTGRCSRSRPSGASAWCGRACRRRTAPPRTCPSTPSSASSTSCASPPRRRWRACSRRTTHGQWRVSMRSKGRDRRLARGAVARRGRAPVRRRVHRRRLGRRRPRLGPRVSRALTRTSRAEPWPDRPVNAPRPTASSSSTSRPG